METKQNRFLEDVKKNNDRSQDWTDKSFKKIIDNLFLKNLHGKEKAMGLDEYDSESNSNHTLLPGHIYAFKYMAKEQTKYDDGKIKFAYSDTLPIVLVTSTSGKIISGINLNLCNKDLKTLILNTVYNIDPEFFDHDASKQAHQGALPESKKITGFFHEKKNINFLCDMFKVKYKLTNVNHIFRSYDISKILDIRFLEPWQWQYIPFLDYKQSVKEPILKTIQHVTGIEHVKM